MADEGALPLCAARGPRGPLPLLRDERECRSEAIREPRTTRLRPRERGGTVGASTSREGEMADEALFIGWGEVVRGRESKALDVFNESLQYYARLQQDGTVEGFDAWFLAPHGGDLSGFVLLRGERERLDDVQRS